MKQLIALVFTVMSLCVFAQGSEEYARVFTPGKSWTRKLVDNSNGTTRFLEETVVGDTVVNGVPTVKVCLHLDEKNDNQTYYYQEDKGRVAMVSPLNNDTIQMYDFNANVGDTIDKLTLYDTTYYIIVDDVQYKDIRGVRRKVISSFGDKWIEGIGAFRLLYSNYSETYGEFDYLYECRDNGKVIYHEGDLAEVSKKEFDPLFVEGKSWTWSRVDESGASMVVEEVVCDTVVNGEAVTAVALGDYMRYFREVDGVVSQYYEDRAEFMPVVRFDVAAGDSLKMVDFEGWEHKDIYLKITDVRTVTIRGVDRMVITTEYGETWIEGIGSLNGSGLTLYPEHGVSRRLMECRQHGEIIYKDGDLDAAGIVVPTRLSDSNVYDLNGRRVVAPAKGQILIQNGRKVLQKD